MNDQIKWPDLLRRKQGLEARTQRITGRLEEAKKNLQLLEKECESKNIDPDQLDTLIDDLQGEIKTAYTSLKEVMDTVDQKLQTYEV